MKQVNLTIAFDEEKHNALKWYMSKKELEKLVAEVTKKMQKAAAELNFEAAAQLRDQMIELKNMLRDID